MEALEGAVLLRQSVQSLYCVLVRVVRAVVFFCVLLVGGSEATFSVVQQTVEFSQPRPYSFFLRSRCRRRVPSRVRGAVQVALSAAGRP